MDIQAAKKVSEDKRNWSDLFFPSFCKLNNENTEKKVSSNKNNVSLLFCQHSPKCKICSHTKKNINVSDSNYLIEAHHQVCESGKYNFEGCKIPVNFRMNINYIRSWLFDYKDTKLIDLLEFGFPIGFKGNESILS